ncbi:MAG: hypothetical protein AAF799_24945 [Myxococcota bacterium]
MALSSSMFALLGQMLVAQAAAPALPAETPGVVAPQTAAPAPESPPLMRPDSMVPAPPAEPAEPEPVVPPDSAALPEPTAEAAPPQPESVPAVAVEPAPAVMPPPAGPGTAPLMSDAVAEPLPVVELSPIDTDAPKTYPAPKYKGTALLAVGGVIGAGTLIYRGYVSAIAIGEVGNSFLGPQFWLLTGGVTANPAFVISLGMIGGGMGMRGRSQAHHDMFETGEARPSFVPVKPRLGWGLVGGGAGLWIITRFVGYLGCQTDTCSVATLETGAYASLGAVTAGLVLGAYGTGYRRYTRDHQSLVSRIRAQPVITRTFSGISVAGRF